jgi:cleavage and polyadenylation specificity factor subunit 2
MRWQSLAFRYVPFSSSLALFNWSNDDKIKIQAPVYVTIPVYKMGQMVMYDAWAACRRQRDMSLFSLGDIDQAFDKMVQLKYSQTHALTGRGAGIEITPYAAGHTIGGAVWRIQKETEDIIYALDYNHKPERHLNPTLLETLQNPTLLITDAYNMNVNQIARQKRDEDLTSTILSALRADGEVLLPVDAAGRVLELLIVLEQYWTANKLHYPIIFLSAVANSTIEYAKSQMEWMSEKLQERFQQQRENPYNLRHVQLVHSLEELDRISKPRVVLATMPSLTVGHAQELFFEMAQNPNNQVIFTTSRGLPGTLAKQLISPATEVKPIHISTQVYRRVPLEGEELEEYMNKQQQEAEAAELARKQEEEAKRRLRNAAASEAYEGEDVDSAKSLVNLWKSYDLFAEREETTLKSMSVYPMFPYVESRAIYDEYGEAIRPEDYATAGDDDEAGSFGWNGQLATIDDDDDMMDVDGADAVPTKSISVDVEVDVACRIKYIDFEGRSDGRSIPKILSRVAPQQLVRRPKPLLSYPFPMSDSC